MAKECVKNAENDPVVQIKSLIDKKYKNKLGDPQAITKTINALARRGFAFSDIRAALKNFTDTELNEEC